MPRFALAAFLIAMTTFKGAFGQDEIEPNNSSCPGLPISHFESRFPPKMKRLTFESAMLETFVDLWKAGARPDLPKAPERVVIYALPGLPLDHRLSRTALHYRLSRYRQRSLMALASSAYRLERLTLCCL